MKTYILYSFITVLVLQSCTFFNTQTPKNPLARVNDTYLDSTDVNGIVPKDASETDSATIINAYINNWATKQLLLNGAKINLPEAKQNQFLKLAEQYKTDLFTKAYLELLVKKNLDTTVSQQQAKAIYQANKESFKLNDDLLQLRYLCLSHNTINLDTFKTRFLRFKPQDKTYLDSVSVQFKSHAFNDSLWVKASEVVRKIPVINSKNKAQLLKKSNIIELKDSLHLYLIKVNNVRLQNNYAPIDYVMQTIKKIVTNKRKIELTKKLEKDIITHAIKSNTFQIYK